MKVLGIADDEHAMGLPNRLLRLTQMHSRVVLLPNLDLLVSALDARSAVPAFLVIRVVSVVS